jgi:hypothetical protein
MSWRPNVKAGIHVGTGAPDLPVYEVRLAKKNVGMGDFMVSYMVQDDDGGPTTNWAILSMAARYINSKDWHSTSWSTTTDYFPVTTYVETDPAGNPIGVENIQTVKSTLLLTAMPDPFNAATTLGYSLKEAGRVTLDVFNVEGKRVVRLLDGQRQAGSGAVKFDAGRLPGGVYVAQMVSGQQRLVKRMSLLK